MLIVIQHIQRVPFQIPHELKNFYHQYYSPTSAKIFLSGKIDTNTSQLLEDTFGSLSGKGTFLPAIEIPIVGDKVERKQ